MAHPRATPHRAASNTGATSAPHDRTPRLARLHTALVTALALVLMGAGDDEPHRYPRIDPDNPGGERVGDDDGSDGFTGYPADPGEPGDAYRDAGTEWRRYSPNWTGAFIGGGPLVGLAALRGDLTTGVDRTVAAGAFFNWSSVSQIVDLQFQYLRADYSPSFDGVEGDFLRQSVGGNILFHPLFLSIIGANRASLTLSNTYVLGGLGLEFNELETDAGRVSYRTHAWRIGGGTGTYLDNPHDGGAFWLGIQFQRVYVQGDPDRPEIGRNKLRENLTMLRISYRWNGNVFAGFRGPRGRSADSYFESP